jgi:hypothetical protein
MELLWMFLTGFMALALGRSVLIWGFLGYAVGWPAMIIVLLFGAKKARIEERMAWLEDITKKMNDFADKHEKKDKGFKDFNTVDDLFKQLENK